MLRAALTAFLLLTAWESPAFACESGLRTPTNFELVQKADLIVLARVLDGPESIEGSDVNRPLTIAVERVIKGRAPPSGLKIFGSVKWQRAAIPAMPTPLDQAHFSADLGSCIRIFYAKGAEIVAMFRKTPEGFVQIADPSVRAVEDVEGPRGVWVRAIEEYLAIQRKSGKSMQQAVESRRSALFAMNGDNAAQAIADDLRRYQVATGPRRSVPVGPRWKMFDGPGQTYLGVAVPDAARFGSLSCSSKEAGVIVEAFGVQSSKLVLTLAGVTYAVQDEARMVVQGHSGVSGRLPLTAELAAALKHATGTATLSAGGVILHAAPPLDVFEKFASRCEALAKVGQLALEDTGRGRS